MTFGVTTNRWNGAAEVVNDDLSVSGPVSDNKVVWVDAQHRFLFGLEFLEGPDR